MISGDDRFAALKFSVSPDYFRAMGMRLIEGRYLTEHDGAGAPPVVVINQTMAHRFWPKENAIGRHLTVDGAPASSEIVGIVGDVKHLSLERQWDPEMYLPYQQDNRPPSVLVVRTVNDPRSVVGTIKTAVQMLDRSLPLYNIKTMDERLSESVARRRFTLLLLGLFACTALVLATTGIYGVTTYAVTQRTREIGIRIALGAQPRDVVTLIVGQGMVLILIGVSIGLAGAFALTRVMASLLFEVTSTDPETFIVIGMLLTSVALFASYIPARRATRIDPLIALRYE
jgi:putative ABC transport system permease protein